MEHAIGDKISPWSPKAHCRSAFWHELHGDPEPATEPRASSTSEGKAQAQARSPCPGVAVWPARPREKPQVPWKRDDKGGPTSSPREPIQGSFPRGAVWLGLQGKPSGARSAKQRRVMGAKGTWHGGPPDVWHDFHACAGRRVVGALRPAYGQPLGSVGPDSAVALPAQLLSSAPPVLFKCT